MNQQQNGGQWNLLGTYTFTAGQTVTLTSQANGHVIADAIRLVSGAPQAQAMYFIHPDHLNTPRLITNNAGQAMWRWDQADPFGGNVPNENPSGLGTFICNLRLPGQYFDKETNLHYNYFRDYDAGIGRYIQSDPIGLAGGINTYVYTKNPLGEIDPHGLSGNAPGTYGWGGPSGPVPPRQGPTLPVSLSAGVGAIGILGIQGGALELGFATNFKKLCGYFQECEIRGLGACIAVGPQIGIQRGAPSTGMQQQAGIAAAGGRGLGSDIQITFDPEGNIGGVKGLPSALPAYGGGGGYIECKTIYKCFPQ